ncbi:hypothetical protein BDZ94DRAFT_1268326 [Collybia nuda]|uniref:Uncharacterized protein n=1 Tax=Collybia nuda TaxID=64659 RepID=A0A9P5XZD1_9AGAR|nr:hypothetical protein BDZ94DRAFT_1268326 [Collybia nuda]
MSKKTFPSFSFVISSHRESFAMPDYYRPTRHEEYGPYYREVGPPQDLMKTIDHRGRDSPEPEPSLRYTLSDIFEEDETEVASESEHGDNGHKENHQAQQNESTWRINKLKQVRWIRHFVSIVLKPRRGNAQLSKNDKQSNLD